MQCVQFPLPGTFQCFRDAMPVALLGLPFVAGQRDALAVSNPAQDACYRFVLEALA